MTFDWTIDYNWTWGVGISEVWINCVSGYYCCDDVKEDLKSTTNWHTPHSPLPSPHSHTHIHTHIHVSEKLCLRLCSSHWWQTWTAAILISSSLLLCTTLPEFFQSSWLCTFPIRSNHHTSCRAFSHVYTSVKFHFVLVVTEVCMWYKILCSFSWLQTDFILRIVRESKPFS